MNVTIPRSHSLEELDALIERLRREPRSPEEIERLRRVAAEVDRLRNQSPPITVPIEELIRREQGD